MRVEVDRKKCMGHGQCNATAPHVYELDDEGYALASAEVPPGSEEDAAAGAASCPERAITVIE